MRWHYINYQDMAALIAATTGEAVVHEKTISKTIGQSLVGTVSRLSVAQVADSFVSRL